MQKQNQNNPFDRQLYFWWVGRSKQNFSDPFHSITVFPKAAVWFTYRQICC